MGAEKICRDDVWEFLTNTGYLTRHIRSVTRNGTVSYINSDGQFCQCSLATFRRWAKGARLQFRQPLPAPPEANHDR